MATQSEPYFPLRTEITDTANNCTYVLTKLLGRGAYAQCFLVLCNGAPFAMKIVRLADLKSEKIRQKLDTEIAIHRRLHHPNIVQMHSSFRNSDYVFMVLELCERGALDELLRRNKQVKERYVARFVAQLVAGLRYMHDEMSVVHRDLKLGNLFLDRHLNIKIGDFGLSAVISGSEKRRTVCGTPNYIAPEVLFGKASGHSFEADLWSLGVIIYTLLVGKPPFQQKKVEEIYKLIERNEYIFPPGCQLSEAAVDLISRLLTTNPQARPTLDDIAAHRLLTQRENLAQRICARLDSAGYTLAELAREYPVFSSPVAALGGIGYVMASGSCGLYYQDGTNVYMRGDVLVHVRLSTGGGRKVFVTEEHRVAALPEAMAVHCRNIQYFQAHYVPRGLLVARTAASSLAGAAGAHAFVAKIKRIASGLLFVLTNSVFVFDFSSGQRVAVTDEGRQVHAFDDDGPVPFTDELRHMCIQVLQQYTPQREAS